MHIKLERCQRDSVKTQIKFRQDFWLSCMDNSCIIFTLNDYEPENTLLWIWGLTSSQNQKCESDGGQSLFRLLLSLSLIWKQTCTYTQHHCFLTFPSSEIIPCLNYQKKAVGLSRVLGHYLTPSFAGLTWLCPSQAPPVCPHQMTHRMSFRNPTLLSSLLLNSTGSTERGLFRKDRADLWQKSQQLFRRGKKSYYKRE